jgi:hypothetical protein
MKTEQTHYAEHVVHEGTSALVDELVALDKQLAPLKAAIKRYEEVKKILRNRLSDDLQGSAVTVFGSIGEVEFSRCSQETVVTNKKLLVKMLSRQVFDELAQFPLTALAEHLSKDQIERVTDKFYGSRRLSAVRYYERSVH